MSDTTIVITFLGVLGVVLFAIATRLSEALVRFRAAASHHQSLFAWKRNGWES